MAAEILCCGFAEQKLQQRLGVNSLTGAKRNVVVLRKYPGDGLAQIKMKIHYFKDKCPKNSGFKIYEIEILVL